MRPKQALLWAGLLGAAAMMQDEVHRLQSKLRPRSLMVDSREPPPNGDENWRRWPGVLILRFPYASPSGSSTYLTRMCTGTIVANTTDATGPLWVAVTAPECIPDPILQRTVGWVGRSAALPTTPTAAVCTAHAGDVGNTRIGTIERAHWVWEDVQGNNMAAVNVRPDLSLPEAQLVTTYPIQEEEVQIFEQGRYMGYGPDTVVSVPAAGGNWANSYSGAGVLRNSSAMISDVSRSTVRQTDDCQFVRTWGGLIELETTETINAQGNAIRFNFGQLCFLEGDGGAPLFMRYPQTVTGTWYLSGVFYTAPGNPSCLPYNHSLINNRPALHRFTSTSYRRDWIRNITELLANRPPVRPVCPSVEPSAAPSRTATPSPTPTGTPSGTGTPSASAAPAFFAREVNIIWVSLVAVAFTLMVISSLFYVWYRQAQIRAYQRQGLKLKKVLEAPAVGQKDAEKPTEYEARQAEERSLAREGELLAPVRRLSMAVSPEQLAEAEAARAARATRRRSSVAGYPSAAPPEGLSPRAAGPDGTPLEDGQPPLSPSGARRGSGSVTSPKNRRNSTGAGPNRRGSTEGPGGRRRNSLAMQRGADRKYDHSAVASGTGTRFSQYQGEHKEMATRQEDMLAPGEVPQDPDEDDEEEEDDAGTASGPLSPSSQARASPISPKAQARANAASPISPKGKR